MKTDKRILNSKISLKKALMNLLDKKDIQNISVTELCREAHLNRSTFYANYIETDDILIEIQNDFLESIEKIMKSVIKDEKLTRENNKEMLLKVISFLYDEKETFLKLVKSSKDYGFPQKMSLYYMNRLGTQLPAEDKIMFIYNFAGSFSVIQQWLMGEINCSQETLRDLLTVGSERFID